MKTLLVIISHKALRPTLQKAVRETYLKEWGHLIDHKFILGLGCEDPQPDEWVFPVDDGYYGQVLKWHAAFTRALELGYDYVFLTGADTYVVIPRLLQVEPVGQYVGDPIYEMGVTMPGGSGIWFGRQAMEVIAKLKVTPQAYPDIIVAVELSKAGITPATDKRYLYVDQWGPPFDWNSCEAWEQRGGIITVHLGRGTGIHNAQWTLECHQGFMKCQS